jgi:hypothetical protein
MSAARKRVNKKQSEPAKKPASETDSSAGLLRQGASPPVGARSILGECAGAICLVEVTMHSLESREIGHPEQEVLKRALKLIWSVHDWIDESTANDPDDGSDHEEDEPWRAPLDKT